MANPEAILRNYLSSDKGRNLYKLKQGLKLLGEEVMIPSGRIDLLANDKGVLCGIELKAMQYNTRQVGTQLLGYLNYFSEKNGKVLFVAPKVKKGVLYALKDFYERELLEFYECRLTNDFVFRRVYEDDLDDSRNVYYFDEIILPDNIYNAHSGQGIGALERYAAKSLEAGKAINSIRQYSKSPNAKTLARLVDETTGFLSRHLKGKAKQSAKAIKEIARIYK